MLCRATGRPTEKLSALLRIAIHAAFPHREIFAGLVPHRRYVAGSATAESQVGSSTRSIAGQYENLVQYGKTPMHIGKRRMSNRNRIFCDAQSCRHDVGLSKLLGALFASALPRHCHAVALSSSRGVRFRFTYVSVCSRENRQRRTADRSATNVYKAGFLTLIIASRPIP